MLSELRMHLKADPEEFGYYQSSNMQGIIMEIIDPEYAGYLHSLGYNPYSQAIIGKNEKIWCIRTVTQDAYERMIVPVSERSSFDIEKRNQHLEVTEKHLSQVSKHSLLEMFYNGEAQNVFALEFQTPTAFKSDGKYVIFPTARLIFQSLMNKYSASFENMDMYDEDTLAQLEAGAEIIAYRLRSCYFPIEGVRIPAFQGMVKVRLRGNDTIKRYAGMLFRFGEYSGVGIKTSMGMGAIRILRRGSE